MRAGQVVRIRVNPKDCVSVLDVLELAGVNTRGMSYSSLVSLALSSMLQGLRDMETIPDRDGFEYLDKMSPFLKTSQKSKAQFADAIYRKGMNGQVTRGVGKPAIIFDEPGRLPTTQKQWDTAIAAVDRSSTAEPPEPVTAEGPVTAEVREARSRLGELAYKKDLVEDGVEGVIWSAGDEEEYQRYYKVVYPHG